MFNKDLQPRDVTIFLNKLNVLLAKLSLEYQSGTFQTQEDVIDEFQRALRNFYQHASVPFLKVRDAKVGTSPS